MQGQEWKIVRTKTDDPFNQPVQTMVLFNDQPIGFVQAYSIGQSTGNPNETLLLEIACPKVTILEVDDEELKKLMGSKYAEGGEEALPNEEDLKFAEEALKADKAE